MFFFFQHQTRILMKKKRNSITKMRTNIIKILIKKWICNHLHFALGFYVGDIFIILKFAAKAKNYEKIKINKRWTNNRNKAELGDDTIAKDRAAVTKLLKFDF